MFLHARGIVGRIIVAVVGIERAFREGQVTQLDGEEIGRLVLNVGTVIDSSGAIRFAIGFEAHECRPLFVELHFHIQVERRCVFMVQVVIVQNVARVGIEFDFAGELDFHVGGRSFFTHARLEHVESVTCGIGHFGRIRVFGC